MLHLATNGVWSEMKILGEESLTQVMIKVCIGNLINKPPPSSNAKPPPNFEEIDRLNGQ